MTELRTQITRSICWLPAGEHWSTWETDDSSGDWSRSERTRRLIGRLGYRVTTEIISVHKLTTEHAC